MIDLIQWRVCIGMWCGHMKSIKKKSRLAGNMKSHPGTERMNLENENVEIFSNILRRLLCHITVWFYILTVCVFLQLVLSGDVESNPGPVG